MFDVSVGAYHAEGTTVPVQTLLVGVGKHGPVFVRFGVAVAFPGWAATLFGRCVGVRAGVALTTIAENGGVWGRSPMGGVIHTVDKERTSQLHAQEESIDQQAISQTPHLPKPIEGNQLRQDDAVTKRTIGTSRTCLANAGTLLVIFSFATQTRCGIGAAIDQSS